MPVEIRMTVLRPNLSAAGLRVNAPTVRPSRPMAKIGPKADGARPQSSAILGATKAIDWVSKPSSMAMMKHSAVTPNCSGPNLAPSMTALPPPSPMAAIM